MIPIYSDVREKRLVESGKIGEYDYFIVSMEGHHPCAYVGVNKDNMYYGMDLVDELDWVVHGGITYSENYLPVDCNIKDKWFFGWDYAHTGDYTTKERPFNPLSLFGATDWGSITGEKYNIKDILCDVQNLIKYLEKYL